MIITSPLPIPIRPNNTSLIFLIFSDSKIVQFEWKTVQFEWKTFKLVWKCFPEPPPFLSFRRNMPYFALWNNGNVGYRREAMTLCRNPAHSRSKSATKNSQNFSFCHYFPSKCKHLIINHKPTTFPQLARFRFLSWRIFISSVGKKTPAKTNCFGQSLRHPIGTT